MTMKSEQAKSAAEILLRGIRVQLETAEQELQTLRGRLTGQMKPYAGAGKQFSAQTS
jgi:hypothetical protein